MIKFKLQLITFFIVQFSYAGHIVDRINNTNWSNEDGRKVVVLKNAGYSKLAFVLSFTNCPTLCPMLASDLKRISNALKSKKIKFFLISIKPDDDTPEKLKEYLIKHKMNTSDYEFIRNNLSETIGLSNDLSLQFSVNSNQNHTSHSTNIVFVSLEGKILGRVDLTDGYSDAVVNKINTFLKNEK